MPTPTSPLAHTTVVTSLDVTQRSAMSLNPQPSDSTPEVPHIPIGPQEAHQQLMRPYRDAHTAAYSDTRATGHGDAHKSTESGAHSSSSSSAPGADVGPGQLRAFLGAEDTLGVPHITPGAQDTSGTPGSSTRSSGGAGAEVGPGQLRAFLGAEDTSGTPHGEPAAASWEPGGATEGSTERETEIESEREIQAETEINSEVETETALGLRQAPRSDADDPSATSSAAPGLGQALGPPPGPGSSPEPETTRETTGAREPAGVPVVEASGVPHTGAPGRSTHPSGISGVQGSGAPPVHRHLSPPKDSARLQAKLTSRGSYGARLAEAGARLADGGARLADAGARHSDGGASVAEGDASVVYHTGVQNGEVRERWGHAHARSHTQGQNHNHSHNQNRTQSNNHSHNQNHSQSHNHGHSHSHSLGHKSSFGRVGRILGGSGSIAKASAWLKSERLPTALRSKWLLLLIMQALLSVLAAQVSTEDLSTAKCVSFWQPSGAPMVDGTSHKCSTCALPAQPPLVRALLSMACHRCDQCMALPLLSPPALGALTAGCVPLEVHPGAPSRNQGGCCTILYCAPLDRCSNCHSSHNL